MFKTISKSRCSPWDSLPQWPQVTPLVQATISAHLAAWAPESTQALHSPQSHQNAKYAYNFKDSRRLQRYFVLAMGSLWSTPPDSSWSSRKLSSLFSYFTEKGLEALAYHIKSIALDYWKLLKFNFYSNNTYSIKKSNSNLNTLAVPSDIYFMFLSTLVFLFP